MSIPTLHLMLRASARTSGAVFLVAFAAPGVAALWRSQLSRAWNAAENRLLLLFAFLHAIHLGFILWLALALGPQVFRKPAGLVPGAIVYLLIYGLALNLFIGNRRIPLISSDTFRSIALCTVWVAFALAFTVSIARYRGVLPLAVASYAALLVRVAGQFLSAVDC